MHLTVCNVMSTYITSPILHQTLRDVKVVAKEEKVIAPSDADAGPPIDLSILEQRQQAKVTDKAYFDVSIGGKSRKIAWGSGKVPCGHECSR